MRELLRSLPLVVAVLAIPIVPFVLMGGRVDEWFDTWRKSSPDPWTSAGLVVGLLSTDIFLPIPSSMVSTFAGGQLGWLLGALASWAGMSVGAVAGFALARVFGPRFTRWFSKGESLSQMSRLTERYGPSAIILTRGLPVLAEASVLLLGMQHLAWRAFLPPLLLSNLGLSLVYAVFGDVAEHLDSTPLALAVSILLPVLVGLVVQRKLRNAPPA
jgi:membrane protein DedA with SNARE-associated domain